MPNDGDTKLCSTCMAAMIYKSHEPVVPPHGASSRRPAYRAGWFCRRCGSQELTEPA